jgi:hypothetical protein
MKRGNKSIAGAESQEGMILNLPILNIADAL